MNKLKQILRIVILLIFLTPLILGGTEPRRAVPLMGTTERVSVASDGTPGNKPSNFNAISADGRFVVFDSWADNLVEGDVNYENDIFVHDRQTGETTIVSVASDGTHANNCQSEYPDISDDGLIVAFNSCASNLVDDDINGKGDIFVHDRATGETTRVSVASDGTEANGNSFNAWISGDGRYVAFESWANNLVEENVISGLDAFVHDRLTGETTLVSVASDGTPGNQVSASPSLSYDGRYVAFESLANNLVEGDTNGVLDIFVHDRITGETTRVSLANDGTQANQSSWTPAISGDGNVVAFETNASNLVEGDTNNVSDIFVHNRITGKTTRVSVASDGTQAIGSSEEAFISGNGQFVAFISYASNLIENDNNYVIDVFVHDLLYGQTRLVSLANDGSQGDEKSLYPSISMDGIFVAFASQASNLVAGEVNETGSVYVHEQEVEVFYFTQLPVVVK